MPRAFWIRYYALANLGWDGFLLRAVLPGHARSWSQVIDPLVFVEGVVSELGSKYPLLQKNGSGCSRYLAASSGPSPLYAEATAGWASFSTTDLFSEHRTKIFVFFDGTGTPKWSIGAQWTEPCSRVSKSWGELERDVVSTLISRGFDLWDPRDLSYARYVPCNLPEMDAQGNFLPRKK
jgi:hypothetical protein